MSDLHCPATVLVARHGEAEYENDLVSDDGGSLTTAGRAQSLELADSLADRNVALVYSSPMARAVQTAEIVAGRLGCAVRVREAFAEVSVGDHEGEAEPSDPLAPVLERWRAGDLAATVPGSTSGTELIARMRAGLEEIADLHRGETVLVISHGQVMGVVLPYLVANLADDHGFGRALPSCCPVELSIDADGWCCTGWPEDEQ
uniref:Phosphoglycerate mutase n=1 Tax=uncultured Nocardioidaceae bacterium TaxID=253824 RepID=A0A6J4L7S2_9ACTN|nr:MAG: hypothetical protein AVDCRST_MAG46-989 [uncultured Nocardioidaceae bacterium]